MKNSRRNGQETITSLQNPKIKEVTALQSSSSLRRETITSLQNPKVKEVTALQSSSSLRREKGLFIVEGLREVQRCVENGFCLRSLFYCPAVCSADTSASLKGGNIPSGQSTHTQPLLHFLSGSEGTRIFEVSENVYRKMAYREGTEGLLAVVCGNAQDRSLAALDKVLFGDTDNECPDQEHAQEAGHYSGEGNYNEDSSREYSSGGENTCEDDSYKRNSGGKNTGGKNSCEGHASDGHSGKTYSDDGHTAAGIHFPLAGHASGNRIAAPLIVVIESVEKPGNLGAMLRTADAAGVSAVLICDPRTDLYNPNLIRASLGGVFTRNIAVCTSEEAIAWLKARGISILTAQLQDSELYYDTDMTRPIAIVFGTEADGLSDIWRQAADTHIRIPMLGRIDSLNVSASMAVLCYEALRQRHIRIPASEIFSDTSTGTSARASAGITADRTTSETTARTSDGTHQNATETFGNTSSASGCIVQP